MRACEGGEEVVQRDGVEQVHDRDAGTQGNVTNRNTVESDAEIDQMFSPDTMHELNQIIGDHEGPYHTIPQGLGHEEESPYNNIPTFEEESPYNNIPPVEEESPYNNIPSFEE